MAHKFIRVRRVDDHETTAEIAEQSLPVWAGIWEPIPDEPEPPYDKGGELPSGRTGEDKPDDASKPTSRKSRSSAASTDKE